jgi:hypothetical protein
MAYAAEYQGAVILPQYSNMVEQWYDLPVTHDLYGRFKVSNLGNIAEIGVDGNLYPKHQLTHKRDKDRTITIRGKVYRVGIMVALAILGPTIKPSIQPDDAVVIYKDGNRLNNNVLNLELSSKSSDFATILPKYKDQAEYWVDMPTDHEFYGKIKVSNKGNIADIMQDGSLKIKHQGRKHNGSIVRRVSLGNAMHLSHKIIADAFLLKDMPASERSGAWIVIKHKDGIKDNNNVENLQVIFKDNLYAKVLEKYTDEEIYRDLSNIHPLYNKAIISSHGNVKRLEPNGVHVLISQTIDTDGYRNVYIDRKNWKVHRLVCATFNGIPDNNGLALSYNQRDNIGSMVNHKDGNVENNHYTNLEWTNITNSAAIVLEKYTDKEEWVDLPFDHRFYGKVRVSTHGNVAKPDREGKWITIHQNTSTEGYRFVSIDGYEILTHRLIAAGFIRIPLLIDRSDWYNQLDGIPYTVNHKDAQKFNNHYTNLEWVSVKTNNQHARDNGLTNDSIPVIVRDLFDGTTIEFPSVSKVVKHFSTTYETICKAIGRADIEPFRERYVVYLKDPDILDSIKAGSSIGVEYRDYLKNKVGINNSIGQASYMTGVDNFTISQHLGNPDLKNQLIGGYVFRPESEIGKPWPDYTEEQIKDSYNDYFSG